VYYGKEDVLTYEFLSEKEASIVFDNITKVTAAESVDVLAKPRKRLAKKILEEISLDKSSAELFEKFWNAYNKKVSRPETMRSWACMSKEEREASIPRAKLYRDGYKSDIKYMKNPTTWLNQRCWEDVVIPRNDSPIISKEEKEAKKPKYSKPKYIRDDR
tara:strand:- start:10483 stop:10962 length:480 start_codon:yes stop_codon:yes gene_type:complete